jgi:ribose 5-phosphate isomerase A
VAAHAAQLIKPGMTIGIGSGSTVFHFIEALGSLVKEGLSLRAVPTSQQTASLAAKQGIEVIELNDISTIDITVDGADEIDPQLQLIKGGGGMLLQEKMVAAASQQLVIIADHTKLVEKLGAFPLPVEVIPWGWKQLKHRLEQLYIINAVLREKNDQPYLTDHGHYILDCYFQHINDPAVLNTTLNNIPGIVENGLFINMASKAIIGYPDGKIIVF